MSPRRSPPSSPSPPRHPGSCSDADRRPANKQITPDLKKKKEVYSRPTSLTRSVDVAYMQSAAELTVVPHLDIDPLVETESDQIQGLLNRVGGRLLQHRQRTFNETRDRHPRLRFKRLSAENMRSVI